jgi:acyl-CoA carboxylase subunit beta
MARLGARELISRTVDAGSFVSWDVAPLEPFAVHDRPDPEYLRELEQARAETGLDEAVITGEALLDGRRVAVLACEFGFLAGSIGVAAAERLVQAIERATVERLPLVASPTSGGTRMQEGTVAFMQMVMIATAVQRHREAGLPYLVYLRNPTTGGVFASWGSLGQVTAAEPGALVGFLGPRVYEALYGKEFPEGVQTAENLFDHGLLDAVVAPEALRTIAIDALAVMAPDVNRARPPRRPDVDAPAADDTPAWDSIVRSRRPDRPGVRALLKVAATRVTPLEGTSEGERDPGLLLALAQFGGQPCVVLGQDRRGERTKPLGPAGLRVARRGMRLAHELNLPLVSVIDTHGADLSRAAEEGGLAGAIARCLAELSTLPAATVCVLLGEGTGGGALALLPADRVICAKHAWLSPLPPEGASVIRFRTTGHAAEMAEQQGVRSADLLTHGVVDRIVDERPDAADEPEEFLRRLGAALAEELSAVAQRPVDELRQQRFARYRKLGLSADRSDCTDRAEPTLERQ